MWKRIAIFILAGILLAGCQPGFVDLSQSFSTREISQLLASEYLDLVWTDDQTIIIKDDHNYPELWVFDISTKILTPISIETICKRPSIRGLQKLPNQNVGYILGCLVPKSQIIQEISLDTGKSRDFFIESQIGMLGDFSYSMDMNELILVDVNGLYLESSLYHVDVSGQRINITPDFQRADFPAWSPIANVVAFLGTKPYSGSDDPKNWGQIQNLFDYPWKLYLYNVNNQQTEELPVEIVHPGRFKWSPDGRLLAFTGIYEGVPGVWIIDMQNNFKVTRVISNIASFDFSPDSKSIAYVGASSIAENKDAIYIIDLNNIPNP